MIRDQDARPTPPIEFVAMLEENTDLVRDSSDNEAVEQPLADRLLALDLPGRAKPVFDKLMELSEIAGSESQVWCQPGDSELARG